MMSFSLLAPPRVDRTAGAWQLPTLADTFSTVDNFHGFLRLGANDADDVVAVDVESKTPGLGP